LLSNATIVSPAVISGSMALDIFGSASIQNRARPSFSSVACLTGAEVGVRVRDGASLAVDAGCQLSLSDFALDGKLSMYAEGNSIVGRQVTVQAPAIQFSDISKWHFSAFPQSNGGDLWLLNGTATLRGDAIFDVEPSDYVPPVGGDGFRLVLAQKIGGPPFMVDDTFASFASNLSPGVVEITGANNGTHYIATFLRAQCPPPAPTSTATCNPVTREWQIALTNSTPFTDPIVITTPNQVLIINVTSPGIAISSPIIFGVSDGTRIRLVGDFCAKVNSSITVKVNATQITSGQSQTVLSAQCFIDEGINIIVEGPSFFPIFSNFFTEKKTFKVALVMICHFD
jgi:hypothetical protein